MIIIKSEHQQLLRFSPEAEVETRGILAEKEILSNNWIIKIIKIK